MGRPRLPRAKMVNVEAAERYDAGHFNVYSFTEQPAHLTCYYDPHPSYLKLSCDLIRQGLVCCKKYYTFRPRYSVDQQQPGDTWGHTFDIPQEPLRDLHYTFTATVAGQNCAKIEPIYSSTRPVTWVSNPRFKYWHGLFHPLPDGWDFFPPMEEVEIPDPRVFSAFHRNDTRYRTAEVHHETFSSPSYLYQRLYAPYHRQRTLVIHGWVKATAPIGASIWLYQNWPDGPRNRYTVFPSTQWTEFTAVASFTDQALHADLRLWQQPRPGYLPVSILWSDISIQVWQNPWIDWDGKPFGTS